MCRYIEVNASKPKVVLDKHVFYNFRVKYLTAVTECVVENGFVCLEFGAGHPDNMKDRDALRKRAS
jgi:hypothetical protein